MGGMTTAPASATSPTFADDGFELLPKNAVPQGAIDGALAAIYQQLGVGPDDHAGARRKIEAIDPCAWKPIEAISYGHDDSAFRRDPAFRAVLDELKPHLEHVLGRKLDLPDGLEAQIAIRRPGDAGGLHIDGYDRCRQKPDCDSGGCRYMTDRTRPSVPDPGPDDAASFCQVFHPVSQERLRRREFAAIVGVYLRTVEGTDGSLRCWPGQIFRKLRDIHEDVASNVGRDYMRPVFWPEMKERCDSHPAESVRGLPGTAFVIDGRMPHKYEKMRPDAPLRLALYWRIEEEYMAGPRTT
jgi:hypothetical protein